MDRVLAIIVLRTKLLLRRMRGAAGAANLIGAVLLSLVGLVVAAGLAFGFGALMYALIVENDRLSLLPGCLVFFYTCTFFGIFLPVLRGAMDEGFDAAPFLVYPISRRRLFGITLGAAFGSSEHLLYLPSLAAVALMGVVLPGVNLAAGLALIVLALVFNVLWGHLLTLVLATIMRARRVKEILAFVVIALILVLSLLPLTLDNVIEEPKQSVGALLDSAGPLLSLARVLAPSLAAVGLAALHDPDGGTRTAVGSILGLILWNAGGLGLGYYVFTRYHVSDRSRAKERRATRQTVAGSRPSLLSFDRIPLSMLPPEVRAIAAKDLHYILRSVVGRFNLFVAPLFVLIVATVVEDHVQEPVFGIDPKRLLLFGMLFYAVMFSNHFVNNAFAWESSGAGWYFMGPVSLQRVLAGKNLAVWLFNAVLFVQIIVTWSIIMGLPDPLTLLTALLLFAAAHLFFTSWGNVVSVLFPLPRNVSALASSPSQIAVLLSILALAVMGLLIGPFLSVPTLLGLVWLQPIALLVLLAAFAGVYVLSLRTAARLLTERKDRFIEALRNPG